MITRREAVTLVGAGVAAPLLARLPSGALGPRAQSGWAALDLATGRRMGEGGGERLPMCSTFKWLLAARVLYGVDYGREKLDRPIEFGPAALVDHAPVVAPALAAAGGTSAKLTVRELCEAIMRVSDNAAANILLKEIGGPDALTGWLRALGDRVTRLDRMEPGLNAVGLNDPRDTTTPDAMVGSLRQCLYGDVLHPTSRARLLAWLRSCETGAHRLPAGLPADWRIGHRTGTRTLDARDAPSERAAAGDVGVLLPPRGGPILLAAYTAGWTCTLPEVEAWFADIARQVVAAWR